jgi:hypothetical protein
MRLMDIAKAQGFTFERVAPGEDAPLRALRESPKYRDVIYIAGFSSSCWATRARRCSLIVPGGPPVTARVEGDAVTVLHRAVMEWSL